MCYFVLLSAYVGSVLQTRTEKGSSFNHCMIGGRSFCRHSGVFFLFFFFCSNECNYACFNRSVTAVKTVTALVLKAPEVLLRISCLLAAAQGEERECAFTDQQQQWEVERMAGGEGQVSPENTTVRCGKGSYCFGLWEKSPPGDVRLVKQGTWPETWDTMGASGARWKPCFYFSTSKSTMCRYKQYLC